MFTRIALMIVMVATLCGASFTLGSASSGRPQDTSGIPAEHPVMLALHYQRELALDDNQLQKLNAMRDEFAKEFAPLRQQVESLQHRMLELKQSENPNQDTAAKLKQEGDAIGAKMKPIIEGYAHQVGQLLTDEQRQKLTKFANAAGHHSDGQEFVLNTIMESRDQLGITPQQFTKLQYLLADFIREFAPIRERMELVQIEIQDKFGKAGKSPAPEYIELATDIQKQVADLQTKFSARAASEVLDPKQRTKLGELLNGDHRSKSTGG